MKVLIITEGGKNFGLGHLTRCISLYQAFEEKGLTPELVINGDSAIPDLVQGKKYQMLNWIQEKDKVLKLISNSDTAVVDSYLAEKSFYKKIYKQTGGKLVVIDDYNRLEYPGGILVNPSIYGDRLDYSHRDDTTYLLGPDYVILRKEFWNIPEKKINRIVRNILITFGGIGRPDFIHKTANYLRTKFNFKINPVEPHKKRLDAQGILNLMLQADICISGGGQTLYELARIGVSTIGICFCANQRMNLEAWHKKGFLEYIGWHRDKSLLQRMQRAINKLMPYEDRVKRSRIGERFVNGKGARRIVDKALKASKKI